jgi:parvulin-like peptidyl-prolyl isomerase
MTNSKNNKTTVKKLTLITLAALTLTSCTPSTKLATFKSSPFNSKVTLSQAQSELDRILGQKTNKEADKKTNTQSQENQPHIKFSNLTKPQKETIIKDIILKQISLKTAKKQNLHQEADYQQAVKNFKETLLIQKLYLQIAQNASTEAKAQEHYNKLKTQIAGKEDLRVRYIAFNSQKEATRVRKKLNKYPKSFSTYAKRYSTHKETGNKGGDLGFVLEEALPVKIKEIAKDLKKQQISQPIKLQQAINNQQNTAQNNIWVIVKLIDKRPAKITDYDQAKNTLKQSLASKALQGFKAEKMKEAKVDILEGK